MRDRVSIRVVSLAAVLLLGVSACAEGPSESEETTTPPAVASTEAVSSAGQQAGESGASDTEAEGSASSGGGEFVPASADGPAQNVPVPVMPEAMKENTDEGAKAAVEYWWETVSYLQLTGEETPFARVSGEGCAFCAQYRTSVAIAHEEGGWSTGTDPEVTSILIWDVTPYPLATVVISTQDATHFYRESNGEITREEEPARDEAPWEMHLEFSDTEGHWVVQSAELIAATEGAP